MAGDGRRKGLLASYLFTEKTTDRLKLRAAKGQSSIKRIARGCVYFGPVIIRTALDTRATCITCCHFYSTEGLLLKIMAEWTLHCLQNMTVKSVNGVEALTCFENTTCGQTQPSEIHKLYCPHLWVSSVWCFIDFTVLCFYWQHRMWLFTGQFL